MKDTLMTLVVLATVGTGAGAATITDFVLTDVGDGSSVPGGYTVYDMVVTADSDWTNERLDLCLTAGSLYQDAFGNSASINPALIAYAPGIEWDTRATTPGGFASFVGSTVIDEERFQASWFDMANDEPGTYAIARITLSDDAQGTLSGKTYTRDTAGKGVCFAFNIVDGQFVPQPPETTEPVIGDTAVEPVPDQPTIQPPITDPIVTPTTDPEPLPAGDGLPETTEPAISDTAVEPVPDQPMIQPPITDPIVTPTTDPEPSPIDDGDKDAEKSPIRIIIGDLVEIGLVEDIRLIPPFGICPPDLEVDLFYGVITSTVILGDIAAGEMDERLCVLCGGESGEATQLFTNELGSDTPPTVSIPEPCALLLMVVGTTVGLLRRRRR